MESHLRWEHLRWIKRNRFAKFMVQRLQDRQSLEEIVETWNRYQKRAEHTVYLIEKEERII